MNLLRPFADAFLAYCLFAQWILRTTNDAHTHQMTRLETDEDDEKKSWKVARFDWSEMHTENEKFAFYSFILLLCNVCPDFFIRNCSDCRNGQKEKKRKRRMVDDDKNREKDISQQITSWNAWKRVVLLLSHRREWTVTKWLLMLPNDGNWPHSATENRVRSLERQKKEETCVEQQQQHQQQQLNESKRRQKIQKERKVQEFITFFFFFVVSFCSCARTLTTTFRFGD